MSTTVSSLQSRLLRVAEVAKYLSLSRSSVYQLMDRGALPYVKLGKSRRVPLDSVEQLIASSTVGGK